MTSLNNLILIIDFAQPEYNSLEKMIPVRNTNCKCKFVGIKLVKNISKKF